MDDTNMKKNVKTYVLKVGLNPSINWQHFKNNFDM